jgi:hypothetical protein
VKGVEGVKGVKAQSVLRIGIQTNYNPQGSLPSAPSLSQQAGPRAQAQVLEVKLLAHSLEG